MKLNDVKIGERVFTRVGDKRVEVEAALAFIDTLLADREGGE